MLLSHPEPPKISSSSSPEELTIAVNSPLELECSAVGVPPPTLSWLKDGRPLEGTDIVQQDGHFVRISKVQVTYERTIFNNIAKLKAVIVKIVNTCVWSLFLQRVQTSKENAIC